MTKKKHAQKAAPVQKKGPSMVDRLFFPAVGILLLVAGGYYYFSASRASQPQVPAPAPPRTTQPVSSYQPTELWLKRAYEVDALFHEVYTPCWEGAYGAIGDAYLFATTNDSSLLQFH